MNPTSDKVLAAAGLILIYALLIGYTDNYVRVIAAEAGLWQFHATRTAMAMLVLALAAWPLGLRLRPVRLGAVAARSAIHGFAMVIYFGALAFLPVAQVAAGLFTAPIFVLLIAWLAYGQRMDFVRILAVGIGFLGVLLVLGPEAISGANMAALLPVIAGAMYAMGNIATRQWCAAESAGTMVAGFFIMLGVIGVTGMVVLQLFPVAVPGGTAGFLHRGPVWPSGTFYFWTFVQAAGSVLAVGLMIRAYQIAEAAYVSVFEYIILPASAFWGWVLWGEVMTPLAWAGMAMIAAAGGMIALRGQGGSGQDGSGQGG